MNWKDIKEEMPELRDVETQREILVKGKSDWLEGQYYVALWDGKSMLGTGTFPEDGIYGFTHWAYID
jgi:hypothetical protein